MMIVMKEGATAEQIDAVVDRVESVGCSAHVSRGELLSVIGAIGDRDRVASLGLEGAPGVDHLVPILKQPEPRSSRRLSKFKFGTTEPAGAAFMCSIDGRAFSRCISPKKFRVKRGKRHSFAVYSIDAAGNADLTPDVYSWKVRAKNG